LSDPNRGRISDTRRKFLKQRSDPGDDHRRRCRLINEAMDYLHASAHRFHRWTDTFEGQRLPCGEKQHLIGWQELAQIIGELTRHGARWADHH
jgi:hypothetical protein